MMLPRIGGKSYLTRLSKEEVGGHLALTKSRLPDLCAIRFTFDCPSVPLMWTPLFFQFPLDILPRANLKIFDHFSLRHKT